MCFINTSLFHLAHLITKISQGQENLALQKMRQTAQVCESLLLFVFMELLFEADFPATTSQTSGTPRLRPQLQLASLHTPEPLGGFNIQ